MDLNRISPHRAERKRLVVHAVTGKLEILLTGNPRADAILRRFAARGGAAVREIGASEPTLQQELGAA